ncbi:MULTISPECIES: succinate dehydrogenase cytochrome b subunit [Corynebacterium]|uniref:succinate dehydrogenase cytochrome b subunit n=1 Tax=Corynebacterium TaxID=1716 RepID=UPI000A9703D4|nr:MULTISPECIES: succinate dehydrogenase cytochrome b subunit [unclassified Corynebacterium]QQA99173.1 succinate dehydrogenase cytochrome b subunit [Corynebacterium tuberculostearicum]MDU1461591.1 succinate dehydrogenase cytochrome b subunit [Corynebacterium sp.]MDU2587075.1 succinate dehydrogenase cytochrome b subunit [Corynebacterium sp.]MDU5017375.1 succinate dehydrogenase cytochrome b subunit [Corynebacterium sp.]MDU7102507.1 succinate dehydrogenase cytochrome b subunit [Corynebacterium sp
MTLRNPDREAVAHGHITNEPIRQKPGVPSWVLKLIMAVTGLLFALFVVGHMAGNLKLYLPAHGGEEALDEYGAFLRSMGEPLFPHEGALWIIRAVLLVAIIAHIYGAIALTTRSKASRGKFRRSNLMGGLDSFATKTMLVSGIVLLLFIIFHLLDLTMGVQPIAPGDFAEGAVKANMIATFSRWPVTIVYVIAMCFLFLHLTHGIRLAASDLGITGAKWRQTFLILAYVIPAVVCIGNIVMPLSVALGLVS